MPLGTADAEEELRLALSIASYGSIYDAEEVEDESLLACRSPLHTNQHSVRIQQHFQRFTELYYVQVKYSIPKYALNNFIQYYLNNYLNK